MPARVCIELFFSGTNRCLSLTCWSLRYLEFSAAGFISKLELRSRDFKAALDVYSSWYALHTSYIAGPDVLLGFTSVFLRLERSL
jgi:hypothetical protein